MYYLLFLIAFSLFAAPMAAATSGAKKDSTARRVLSYSELFAEIQACKDTVYRLENAVVQVNEITDAALFKRSKFDTLVVKPSIRFNNVFLKDWDNVFNRIRFCRSVRFTNVQQKYQLVFEGCVFEKSVRMSDIKASEVFEFNKCSFSSLLEIQNPQVTTMGVVDCHFRPSIMSEPHTSNMESGYHSLVFDFLGTQSSSIALYIVGCNFQPDKKTNPVSPISLQRCRKISRLFIVANKFNLPLNLTNLTVTDAAQISSTFATLDMSRSTFPDKNTGCTWSEVAGKLCIDSAYIAQTDAEIANIGSLQELLAVHQQLLTIYKTRGDRESANGCYVAIKAIETRRAAYLHRTTPTLETWFDWRLNQLLEIFSDYGTNAAKGLIYIFYVIIGFGALYFLFPSEQDNLSRQNSFAFFHIVIGYFSTNTTLTNLSDHKRRRTLDDLQNFRATLELSRKEIPAFVSWLGAPLYTLNKMYVDCSAWLVQRFDIVPGRWDELPSKRKLWTSVAISLYVMGFLLWGIIMRLVNAFALSINAFVTLGYGEIQARGAARYLAVLEGAIGWFLLSIFSVTLISQLLQ